MFYILISVVAGAIVVISRVLNTKLSENIGLIESSFFNYLTGLLSSLILFILMREKITLNSFNNIPFWAYLGGLLGAVVVILSSVVTPKLSSFNLTLIIFIGQLITGIFIDIITLGTISYSKIIGGLLVILGLAYNLHIDSTLEKNKSI